MAEAEKTTPSKGVKVRALFDSVTYRDVKDDSLRHAQKGEEFEITQELYDWLMREESSLPAIPESQGGSGETRYPVEKI